MTTRLRCGTGCAVALVASPHAKNNAANAANPRERFLVFMTPSRCIVERRINARSDNGLCARCGARATERKSSRQRTQGTQRNDLPAPCSLCTLWLRSEEHTSELQSLTNLVC